MNDAELRNSIRETCKSIYAAVGRGAEIERVLSAMEQATALYRVELEASPLEAVIQRQWANVN